MPFLCTQDGVDGETDVVWNYYTPKSDNNSKPTVKNTTPLSTRSKRLIKQKNIDKSFPKRKMTRTTQKNTQLLQDLIELNQNIHKFIGSKSVECKENLIESYSSNDDNINKSNDFSPKSGLRSNSRCLRKNLLTSKFNKPDCETALESDDSMNEVLIAASQVVEENIKTYESAPAVNSSVNKRSVKPVSILTMDQDSMDAILNSINIDSPILNKTKTCGSPHLGNDSFDNLVGDLNDSALDRLSQIPLNKELHNNSYKNNSSQWTIKEVQLHESQSSKFFGRHSSMPESPRINEVTKPSTSGMAFGRHSSLPHDNQDNGMYRHESLLKLELVY